MEMRLFSVEKNINFEKITTKLNYSPLSGLYYCKNIFNGTFNCNHMKDKLIDFNAYRSKMNKKLLSSDNLVIKRFFNLDTNAYLDGAIPAKTKEMLGLVSSMVLRCDDCIKYHLIKCHEQNLSREELFEIFAIANLVGGSIVIPHTRRALEFWEELEKE